MSEHVGLGSEARADRRVVFIAVGIMIALVVFGVGFGSLFGATSCRQVRADVTSSPAAAAEGAEAGALLAAAGPGSAGVAALESALGTVVSAVTLPLDAPLRLGGAPTGIGSVVVTGDGAAVVSSDGDVTSAATFRRPVTVVGDGIVMFALSVGNTRTGQVDAIQPLVPTADGLEPGTCVDTSAVGSPLAFLHDARDGNLVGLRTDEDGSDVVLELRDHVRGRVWAPVLDVPRAPAGLQGARTSGALGPDTVVIARRMVLGEDDDIPALRAFARSDGQPRWEVDATAVRTALPAALAAVEDLRMEVVHVGDETLRLIVYPDAAPDAPLPLPTFSLLGEVDPPHPDTVTSTVDVRDGRIGDVVAGPAPFGRDGSERDGLRASVAATGVAVDDVLATSGRTWLLVGDVLAQLGR